MKFPADAPRSRVLRTLQFLGFEIVREREHIALMRRNADGTVTPLTVPNHRTIKSSTLRTICNQAGIDRDEFLRAYERFVPWVSLDIVRVGSWKLISASHA